MEYIDLSGKILQGHGRYRIKRLIGYGAHGQVWEAWHDFLGRLLAIKVIDASSLDPVSLERVKRECSIGGELGEEAGIVRVHDAFEEHGIFYIVMDLMEGGNLQKIIKENIPILHTTIGWATILSDALLKVHQHNIIHRDIKPQNILFTRSGQPRISDFGVAHIPTSSFTETQPGTPGYKAPELEHGGEPTFASDVYSLGATLFEVWGNQAFALYKSLPLDVLQRELILLMEQAYPDASLQLRQELASLLVRSLHPDPNHRLELTELYNRLKLIQGNIQAQIELQHIVDNASIATIGDLFTSSFWKSQQVVAKVRESGSLSLEEDLEGFVITQLFARDLRNFLYYFLDDRWGSDGSFTKDHFPVVWISGIFGSGKSLVANIIAALLDNPKLSRLRTSFIDAFSKKLEQHGLSQFEDVQFLLDRLQSRYWCKIVTLSFADYHSILNGDGPSFSELCLRALNRSQGLSSTLWIAQLQNDLRDKELYTNFLHHLSSLINREPKIDDLFLFQKEMTNALAKTMNITPFEAEEYINSCKKSIDDPDYFQKEILKYLTKSKKAVTPLLPRLIFVFDEIKQYISSGKNRATEFRELLKTIAIHGQGNIWVIGVAQTKFKELLQKSPVLPAGQNEISSPYLISIQFDEDYIYQVVMGLLFQKKKVGTAQIHYLIQKNSENVIQLSNLYPDQIRLGLESFATTYPFPPYAFPLLNAVINSLSTTPYLNSARVLTSLTGEVLRNIFDQPVGMLASFDLFYEILWNYFPDTREQIVHLPELTPDLSSSLSVRILKVLRLIQKVEWLPKTAEVIETLLVDRLDADLKKYKQEISLEIEKLISRSLVHREKNGEITIVSKPN